MEALLQQVGYTAVCATDGESALRAAERSHPSAVVLDLLMPGMDGFAFLRAFRDRPEHRRTPVIIWTVKDLSPEEHGRLRQSAQSVVPKASTDRAVLLDEIRAFLPARAHAERA
jgi:CheY-like chemotaxis protein